jgi:hypothetical protein
MVPKYRFLPVQTFLRSGKMKKVIFGFMAFCLVFGFMLTACATKAIPADTNLKIETIEWERDENGLIQFYTNDPAHYDTYYWTFFTSNINKPGTYQVELKRISGSWNYGYGIVFGAADDNFDQFYCVLISADGYFRVDKDDVTWTEMQGWVTDSAVITGFGQTNTIKVIYSGNQFIIYINDIEVYISDTDSAPFGNRFGLWVQIGLEGSESFPDTPVDIRFRQTTIR